MDFEGFVLQVALAVIGILAVLAIVSVFCDGDESDHPWHP